MLTHQRKSSAPLLSFCTYPDNTLFSTPLNHKRPKSSKVSLKQFRTDQKCEINNIFPTVTKHSVTPNGVKPLNKVSRPKINISFSNP